MYKILGADGKEYGPVELGQLKQWVEQGRVNAQTRVQEAGSTEWKPADQVPEIAGFLKVPAPLGATPAGSVPPTASQLPPGENKGLAITSLVLGVLSLVCLGVLTGIPAIICGHIAHGRARKEPQTYGGAGMAIAGFVLGYLSLVMTAAVVFFMLSMRGVFEQAKGKAQEINCVNNMKQIGLAFRTWALDNGDAFPFQVSTNSGGTLELCSRNSTGMDANSFYHFLVMSNELSTPKILVCPQDKKPAAQTFETLSAANVTYQVFTGPEVNETNVTAVLVVCPVHGNKVLCDGSVIRGTKQ
jgi:hypothetical protein